MANSKPTNERLWNDCKSSVLERYPGALQHEQEELTRKEYEHRFNSIGLEGDPYERKFESFLDEFFAHKFGK